MRVSYWSVATRFAIGGLGAVAVMVGIRNAWGSKSPTAVLVVGLVLVALAWLTGPDLAELTGRYKDAEIRLIRQGKTLNVAAALRMVASSEGDPVLRANLEAIAAEFEVVDLSTTSAGTVQRVSALRGLLQRLRALLAPSSHGELPRAHPSADEARAAYFDETVGRYFTNRARWERPAPTYYFKGYWSDAVRPHPWITVDMSWWGDWRIRLTVTTPSGRVKERVYEGSYYMQANNFIITEEGPLEAGEYVFEWSGIAHPIYDERTITRDVVTVAAELFAADPARFADGSLSERLPFEREHPGPPTLS